MSVGVMKDYKLKLRKLRASHTLAKSKKLIFVVKKGSIQWKDAKDVLVKQKQFGELP
jgi:hypothetical protein